MIILSFGIRKSGSTLGFQLARAVLELTGREQPRLDSGLVHPKRPFNAVNSIDDELLTKLVDASSGHQLVIKTHASPNRLSTGLLWRYLDAGDVRLHVVIRDPRDTVLSMLDEAAKNPARPKPSTVDASIEALRPRYQHLRRWGGFPSLKLFYDDFGFDRSVGPTLIGRDLGVEVDPETVWERLASKNTRRNRAWPQRHRTEMSDDDRAKVEAAFPEVIRMVEQRDQSWFAAPLVVY